MFAQHTCLSPHRERVPLHGDASVWLPHCLCCSLAIPTGHRECKGLRGANISSMCRPLRWRDRFIERALASRVHNDVLTRQLLIHPPPPWAPSRRPVCDPCAGSPNETIVITIWRDRVEHACSKRHGSASEVIPPTEKASRSKRAGHRADSALPARGPHARRAGRPEPNETIYTIGITKFGAIWWSMRVPNAMARPLKRSPQNKTPPVIIISGQATEPRTCAPTTPDRTRGPPGTERDDRHHKLARSGGACVFQTPWLGFRSDPPKRNSPPF